MNTYGLVRDTLRNTQILAVFHSYLLLLLSSYSCCISSNEQHLLFLSTDFTLDFLQVQQWLANKPSIPHLHTRLYSPLEFASIHRTPESRHIIKTSEFKKRRKQEFEANLEKVSKIVFQAYDIGRRAMRP
jgi:hypothetical protein